MIDSGLMKEKHYNPNSNVASLDCQFVSQVNVVQRRGRAGPPHSVLCRAQCLMLFFDVHALPLRRDATWAWTAMGHIQPTNTHNSCTCTTPQHAPSLHMHPPSDVLERPYTVRGRGVPPLDPPPPSPSHV